MQTSKTIYFPDYPSTGKTKSGLTIPFSAEDHKLYEYVKPLSSHTIRRMIGFDLYTEIERAAASAEAQVATFVRKLLLANSRHSVKSENQFFRIQSTFRGGRGSPLHEWYPYLEGYSPEFVSNVIETFSPQARDILDPFCGSGTTALISALRGGIGYYSEVNPACQFVIAAKALALTLSAKERTRIADQLHNIAQNCSSIIRKNRCDESLKDSFLDAFGERPFFENQNFDAILRARAFADKLEKSDPALGRFFIVGVLRSLVPCSLLVRRGDLRFKMAHELSHGIADFFEDLSRSLDLIASDILDSDAAPGSTRFVTDDARKIASQMRDKVDAVITSPPYLNGTNYFRNTKIELWFLRKLKSKSDLRNFRNSAITSGINDVTQSKLTAARNTGTIFQSSLLGETIKKLGEVAYDSRIPAMVENYFYDMHKVLSKLPDVLNPGGIIAIDLGDSIYGGVHVPTQDILAEILESSGFHLKDTIILRERKSRDGGRLSQTLQVFTPKVSKPSPFPKMGTMRSYRLAAWNEFKTQLPHQKGEMARRNWGHAWHSMCSYQGKLKPAIASCLVDALMPKSGGRMLDIFSGVGTIPFEARMRGHIAFGFDISPAAVAISRAKLQKINWEDVENLIEELEDLIEKGKKNRLSTKKLEDIRFNGPLVSYFHEDTLHEVLIARKYFLKHEPESGASAVVLASLLHILHGNRPYALSRRSHPITPFAPTGPTEYRNLIERLRMKVERIRLASPNVPEVYGKSFFQDVTKEWPKDVDELDAIITSPPFFDSTRFHTANWLRLWFSGWEAKDFSSRPADFVDEKQKKSFDIYENIFRQARDRLKTGGIFAVHVGKSSKCDMGSALRKVGEQHLRFEDWFSESVEHCESHGIRDKGTVTHHQYLLFEKTG
ncbi:MAG: class I SAM-dependent methyltransferase [Cellvibrionaceae bacterium]|nr:class I SAM-dependent methyltransferase [Cellvibrionaceae bacterium]